MEKSRSSRKDSRKLLLIMTVLLLPLLATSCVNLGAKSTILRNDEQVFFIPKGKTFPTIDKGKEIDIVAPEDMAVLFKGQLLKLEEEATNRVYKTVKVNKKKATIFGSLAGVIGIIGAFIKKRRKK